MKRKRLKVIYRNAYSKSRKIYLESYISFLKNSVIDYRLTEEEKEEIKNIILHLEEELKK